MKIFTKDHQPKILEKYKFNFLNNFLNQVKVPNYNEYIGTIYMFVNNINGKIYIGQTMVKFYERFRCHFIDTFTKKDDLIFHQAIRKYGWDNFSKYIIWQDSKIYTKEFKSELKLILDIKEQEYIKYYNSNNIEYGYNMTKGGTCISEKVYEKKSIEKAQETKLKNKSNYMLNRKYDKHHLAIPILQYDYNKNLIKRWACIKLAEDTLNLTINPQCLTSGGYFWVYDSDNYLEILNKKFNTKIKLNNSKPNIDPNTGLYLEKPIYCFDLFGKFINFYTSVNNAARSIERNASCIANVARLKELGHVQYNYIWIYEEDLLNKDYIIEKIKSKSKLYRHEFRPVYQIYLNGDVIKLWNNVKEIITEYPFIAGSLNKCLNHKLNVYNDCFWIFEDECSDELLLKKFEAYSKTKKNHVKDILSGKIIYSGMTNSIHNTVNSKENLKNHKIYQFNKDLQLIKIWENYKNIQLETDFNFATISKCLRHKLKTAFGFIWRFENDLPEIYKNNFN